jgi:hypothetical protein
VLHPGHSTFIATFPHLCCIVYSYIIEMDGHLSLGQLRSVWMANCGERVEDFLSRISTVHLATPGQKSHEECPDTIEAHSAYPPWLMMPRSLRFFDFFPGRRPFWREIVGTEHSCLISCP